MLHDLTPVSVPLSELEIHPDNPRRGDIPAIAESLRLHGQYRPIVVQRSRMRIVAGNHTFQAAVLNGWSEIAAVLLDVDDREAQAILLADNRTSDLGGYDKDALIESLLSRNGDLLGTGYSQPDVDALLTVARRSTDQAVREFTVNDVETANTCPSCGYEW